MGTCLTTTMYSLRCIALYTASLYMNRSSYPVMEGLG